MMCKIDVIQIVDDDTMMSATNVASVTQAAIYKRCVRPANSCCRVLQNISIVVVGVTTVISYVDHRHDSP